MKNSLFKQSLIIGLCFISVYSFGQNNSHIKFRSIYAEVGMFTTLDGNWDTEDFNGINFTGGIDFFWDDVIFGARIITGTSPDLVDYFENGDESYTEWNFTLGKEWKFSSNFSFDGTIGVGLFYHRIESSTYNLKEELFALSLKPQLRYYFTDNLSLALGSQFNILPLFLSGGLSLQYHFN
ncbi:hypothetical protein [Aegicerativicinus sediminis]|uniref:hypothetical protein n=1 Tax=Aegicerativicinus sediminis TaxID=2893202 RepID=UPI001E522E01|nr:hypothetical protein [Aegicerativicinus sediminis]